MIQRVGDFFACYMNKDALDAKLLMDAFMHPLEENTTKGRYTRPFLLLWFSIENLLI